MAPDFKSYLVTQIVAEKQTVTYRNVSRALKVHVNAAKCMLFEFWEKENRKNAASVYATYLIAGTKKQESKPELTNGNTKHTDDDVPMPSSPPPPASSMPEPSQQNGQAEHHAIVPVKTISLVREEDLESVKSQYDNITSIHIYSLSPGRLGDLVILTDISRGIYTDETLKEDPLANTKVYGIIQNSGVRRRKGKRPVIPAAPPATRLQPAKEEKKEAPKPSIPSNKTETTETSRPGSRDSSTSASSAKQPTLKRDGSNLFKAFAKAQNKSKLNREETDASTNASASGTEDAKMTDADEEGESEDDALFLDTGTRKSGSKKRPSEIKQEREDKRAKLRKMMDSDDEAEKAVPNVEKTVGANEEPPAASEGGDHAETADDAEDVAWSDSDTERQKQKAPNKDSSFTKNSEPTSTVPQRRRGRRQVPKKRTTKDEDGYLVTKEEMVWESFSEDEPEPPKEKPKNAFSSMKSQPSSQKSTASSKGGTQTKKASIASFFGKKQ